MASTDHTGEQPITSQPSPTPTATTPAEPRRRVSIATDPVSEGRLHEGYGYERSRKVSSVKYHTTHIIYHKQYFVYVPRCIV